MGVRKVRMERISPYTQMYSIRSRNQNMCNYEALMTGLCRINETRYSGVGTANETFLNDFYQLLSCRGRITSLAYLPACIESVAVRLVSSRMAKDGQDARENTPLVLVPIEYCLKFAWRPSH